MSQPVALIARIPITEADFKKFLSSPAAKTLAGCIAEALSEPTEEAGEPHYYVVFRYLKPEQAVFAFIYFRYGNATDLCESREWQVLQVLATYTQDGPPGFVLHSLDALNLFESIAAAFSVAGGCCTETSFAALGFDQEQFRKDCRKYFYAVMRENFALQLPKSRIVDKSIVKRCRTLLERRRIEQLTTQFPQASFARPVYLFGNYFFNGQCVYCIPGSSLAEWITLLPEIDAAGFRPTPWGGKDARHAVLGGMVLPVDAATFQILQKGETVFFKDRHRVFTFKNQQIAPLPGADAASFTLKDECLAEDANHIYTCGAIVPKSETGAYRVEVTYLCALQLLVGERAVYLGGDRLPLDAASFRIEHELPQYGPGVGIYGAWAYVVGDAQGLYLLRRNGGYSNLDQVQLTPVPDLAAAQLLLEQEEEKKTGKPRVKAQTSFAVLDAGRQPRGGVVPKDTAHTLTWGDVDTNTPLGFRWRYSVLPHPLAHWHRFYSAYEDAHNLRKAAAIRDIDTEKMDAAMQELKMARTAVIAARTSGNTKIIATIERECERNRFLRYTLESTPA